MATDFNKPVTTDGYIALLAALNTALRDMLMGLEPVLTGASSNLPTGAIRWNNANSYWEKWSGASWGLLVIDNLYVINITGNAGTATTAISSTNATTSTTAASVAQGGAGSTAIATTAFVVSERTNTTTLTNKTITNPLGIVKGNVGLGNVDNTSDVAKPVSTAQQNALNLKVNIPSGFLIGTPAVASGVIYINTSAEASGPPGASWKQVFPALYS